MIDAACRLRHRSDIKWIIIGAGRGQSLVNDAIVENGLQGHVIRIGRRPLEDMPFFFQRADALLVTLRDGPIWNRTIPGKVQAYLSAGTPILGMLSGEGARVLRESGAAIVADAGDSEGLANAAERLCEMNPSQREAMGQAGMAYGRANFDRARLMTQLWDDLNALTLAMPTGKAGGQS